MPLLGGVASPVGAFQPVERAPARVHHGERDDTIVEMLVGDAVAMEAR
jgi:hypothetical protein